MRRLISIGVAGLVLLLLATALIRPIGAQENDDALEKKKSEIEELQAKLSEIQGQRQTLAQTINYINTRIQLTQKQIENTEFEITVLEEEVEALSGKIAVLDTNLEKITTILVNRINTSYKKTSSVQPIYLLLTSDGLNQFLKSYKYLRVGQRHDQIVMFELEKARSTFNEQKEDKEEKTIELEQAKRRLESQKAGLDQQQREKQELLQLTRNDERQYQTLLSQAKAELAAIQAVIAGKGTETKVRDVAEGDKIASVIVGASACSTGTHLHFEATKDKSRINPFSILKSISLTWDNADSQTNGSGSWNWPLNEPIRVTQSYGYTSYSSRYAGNFHTGIDIVNSSDMTIKSVKSGTLYRGSIACGGGTLRYVKVTHDDGYDTYYLHVNY
jgi:septal ring factor EnvC (AmiA/AmiB activator)